MPPVRSLLIVLTLLAAGSAFAANPKARALAKEADKFYKENKYKEAAEKLQAAYELDDNPVYLYNIARALDQAGEIDASLESYRKYVALPSDTTSPDLVKKANLAMDRLRTLIANKKADEKIHESEKERLEREAAAAKDKAAEEAAHAREQKAAFDAKERERANAEKKHMDNKKLGALIAGGVGVVGLGTALGFGLAASGSKGAFVNANSVTQKKALQGATQTQAAVSDISLLLGLGGLVTGAILFPWNQLNQPEGSVSVAVSPLVGGAYGSVEVRF